MGRTLPVTIGLYVARPNPARGTTIPPTAEYLIINGFRHPSALFFNWLLDCCSCLPGYNPNFQELWHGKAATGAQGYPVFRESLPTIFDALEGVRGLEEAIRQVYPNNFWLFAILISFLVGPLVYLTVGGQGILVLNTHQVAADLLDRRGHIYSDRPRMISKFPCCPS